MGNYLNIGNAGFVSARKGTYVDKTGMISFINRTLGTADKLTCVSRPRRFGKSFAAKMLCAYYDKSCDSRKLFDGLEISGDASFEKYLNKYNVIYLDITEFTSDAFVKREMPNVVINLERKVIDELGAAYPDVDRQDSLPNMLYDISEATGHKFIFIIDEWDALFRENRTDEFLQESYIRLLRGAVQEQRKDRSDDRSRLHDRHFAYQEIWHSVGYDGFQGIYYACAQETCGICGIYGT